MTGASRGVRALAASRRGRPGGPGRGAIVARECPSLRVPGLFPRGLALGSLSWLTGCHDVANWAAFGFCIGVLATSGCLIAFMEQWLRHFSTLNRLEQQAPAELAQVDAELAAIEQPETRR